jgi:hypothetical protein
LDINILQFALNHVPKEEQRMVDERQSDKMTKEKQLEFPDRQINFLVRRT